MPESIQSTNGGLQKCIIPGKIADLTKQWKHIMPICAKVTKKLRNTKSRATNRFFKVHLEDESGIIEAIIFGELVKEFYEKLTVNQSYHFRNFRVKPVSENFKRNVDHDFEINFVKDTHFAPCHVRTKKGQAQLTTIEMSSEKGHYTDLSEDDRSLEPTEKIELKREATTSKAPDVKTETSSKRKAESDVDVQTTKKPCDIKLLQRKYYEGGIEVHDEQKKFYKNMNSFFSNLQQVANIMGNSSNILDTN